MVGFGAVGRRVARALASDPRVQEIVVLHRDPGRVLDSADPLDPKVEVRRGTTGVPPADVTVVAAPGVLRRVATTAIGYRSHVVGAIDEPSEVRAALALDSEARRMGVTVAVGTTMAPGLSCVLARRLQERLDRVEEVHVASFGTGGPACARRHHTALTGVAVDWADGDWRRRPGGSGRELVWFPGPVGGADCYRASLADPLLLMPVFRDARRITARLEATRRDRLTSWLPMLRPPHPEGLVGAARVEVRGWRNGRAETQILGASSPPAVVAALVAAQVAGWACDGRLARTGAGGLAELVDTPGVFLKELGQAGIAVSAFEGRFGG